MPASIPTMTPRSHAVARHLRRADRSRAADQRSRRRDPRGASAPPSAITRWRCPRRSASRLRSTCTRSARPRSAAGWCTVPLDDDFELVRGCHRARRSPRATRIVFLDQSRTTRAADGSRWTPLRALATADRAGAALRRRGLRGLLRRVADRSPHARGAARTWSSAGRSPRRMAWPGFAPARVVALAGDARADAPGRSSLQPQRVGGGGASRRDRGSRLPRLVSRAGGGVPRPARGRVRAPRPAHLAERRQLRAGPRRPTPRASSRRWRPAACGSAIARANTAAGSASASPPDSWMTRAARSPRWRRCCAPRA